MWNIIILPFINDKINTTATYYVDYERSLVTKFIYIYIYTVVKHIFIFNIYYLVLQKIVYFVCIFVQGGICTTKAINQIPS
jgi:hypothetical protein